MHAFVLTKRTNRLVMKTALSISHYMSRAVFILVSLWVLLSLALANANANANALIAIEVASGNEPRL